MHRVIAGLAMAVIGVATAASIGAGSGVAEQRKPLGPGALKGSWALGDGGTSGEVDEADIGLIRFDGKGGCSGVIDTIVAGLQTLSRRLGSCSYSLDDQGRGTLAASLDDGAVFGLSLNASPGGNEILVISTQPRTAKPGKLYRRPANLGRPTTAALEGSWAFNASTKLAALDVVFAGVITLDGEGGCSMAMTENNAVESVHPHTSNTCSYSVSRDGRGTITDTLNTGIAEIRPFVVADTGRIVFLLSVDLPTAFGYGEMVKQ